MLRTYHSHIPEKIDIYEYDKLQGNIFCVKGIGRKPESKSLLFQRILKTHLDICKLNIMYQALT